MLFTTFKPYFALDAGSTPPAGGSTTPPTTPPVTPPSTGGTAAPTEAEKETKELQELTAKETALDAAGKARLEALKGKYDVVSKDDKGNVLTAEQITAAKALETKFNAILAKTEDQRTPEDVAFLKEHGEEDVPAKSIYEQVDEVTGNKYEIDYGDIDPLSIDGVALREDHIERASIDKWENTLRQKYPRAYQYLLHTTNGGKEEDFFKPQNQDFSRSLVKKEDVAGQEAIIRTAMQIKGNTPAIIEAALTNLKDGGKLFETADSELKALQIAQKQRETALEKQENERRLKEIDDVTAFGDSLEAIVNDDKTGIDGIVIPKVERQKFLKFLGDRIDYYNGNFVVTKAINQKELSKELKVAYFEFKGGDLKGVVERTAKSQHALRLKQQIKTEFVPKGQAAPKAYVPFGQA